MNKVDLEVLRTTDYVNDSSCRTKPQERKYKDYQRDKEYLGFNYSDMEFREVYFDDE